MDKVLSVELSCTWTVIVHALLFIRQTVAQNVSSAAKNNIHLVYEFHDLNMDSVWLTMASESFALRHLCKNVTCHLYINVFLKVFQQGTNAK